MNSYEVEIKSLLGVKENADALLEKLKADPSFKEIGAHKQLNHYFIGGDLNQLYENAEMHIEEDKREMFKQLCFDAKEFSVRTRKADDNVILVIKASVDDTTSSNGTARLEFESKVDMSLEELDKILIESGFTYQAKWSRERQEYTYKGMNVSIDKNAGYGYLAEFEKISDDTSRIDGIKDDIRNAMSEIGLVELPQDRLARMFDYYNNNWEDYYGTEKVFNIE
jgi:predicted adenylyl cyclase CyaB